MGGLIWKDQGMRQEPELMGRNIKPTKGEPNQTLPFLIIPAEPQIKEGASL